MNLIIIIWHVFSIPFLLLFGFYITRSVGGYFRLTQKRSLLIYLWHTLWCLAYLYFSILVENDTQFYYNFDPADSFYPIFYGTGSVGVFTYFLRNYFFLPFESVFLVFNIFGTIGLLCFDKILSSLVLYRSIFVKRLVNVVIFLPSLSFWSSSIGKEPIAFCGVILCIWAALSLKSRLLIFNVGLLMLLFCRPHIAALIFFCLFLDSFFSSKINSYSGIKIILFFAISSLFILPFAIDYSGLSVLSKSFTVADFIETRQSYNQIGDGTISLNSMPLPYKMFTYYFRPSIFEVRNLYTLLTAIDNLILLFAICYPFYSFCKGSISSSRLPHVFLLSYSLIGCMLLSSITSNLGISVRQKWMFLPALLIFVFSIRSAGDIHYRLRS